MALIKLLKKLNEITQEVVSDPYKPSHLYGSQLHRFHYTFLRLSFPPKHTLFPITQSTAP